MLSSLPHRHPHRAWSVTGIFNERNWLYLELYITEMPISDTVFQEINAHAYTVDTMRSFHALIFPSPQHGEAG